MPDRYPGDTQQHRRDDLSRHWLSGTPLHAITAKHECVGQFGCLIADKRVAYDFLDNCLLPKVTRLENDQPPPCLTER